MKKYGWGKVLDYFGVEWENPPFAMMGQICMEDITT